MSDLSVGDEIAFKSGHYGNWQLVKIDKITPSGRINAGHYTLNPDLSIRGQSRWDITRTALPTPAIREEIKRYRLIHNLKHSVWADLSTDQLEQVFSIVQGGVKS